MRRRLEADGFQSGTEKSAQRTSCSIGVGFEPMPGWKRAARISLLSLSRKSQQGDEQT